MRTSSDSIYDTAGREPDRPAAPPRSAGGAPARVEIRPEMLPLDRSAIIELLHQVGILPTTQRVHIAEVLFSRPQHLSAEQVLERLSAAERSISRATVYNTLKLFAEHNLVRPVIIDPERVLYDSHTAHHHHFLNRDSGELIDVDAAAVQLAESPELPEGTVLARYHVIFELRQEKRRGNGNGG
ncbi:MAG: hypothetical protein KatS3mg121_1103 [Gammaproteobacteria bacterium]|nr:MAG: hypothetical protein KatS3mg121_1103 [Gammaproteobacteria bacterium]